MQVVSTFERKLSKTIDRNDQIRMWESYVVVQGARQKGNGKMRKMRLKKTTAAVFTSVLTAGSLLSGAGIQPVLASVDKPVLKVSSGWLESAYAEWKPVAGADGYNVYVGKDGKNYTQLDDSLVRLYKAADGSQYFRADALGLSAGSYNIKVVPVEKGAEQTMSGATTAALDVKAHDRSGFAFEDGDSSGAYNHDGTLKSNAVVLYITEETKNTVTMDVVTSSKGATTTCTGLQNILNSYKKGYDNRPLDIRLVGQITDFAVMDGGDIVISGSGANKRISCGITFEGVGTDATADGWGLRVKNASDVEVRNLGFMNCDSSEGDDIGLQQDNDHVWVHNNDLFYGDAGSDADQVKGDGALDTKVSTNITHSYNHFWDNGKCNLQGMKSESTDEMITYHHNWYDHSDSRHPRIRTCSVHSYNNYFDGNAKYGVGVTMGASAFVENNYFRNCKYPMLISMQGSDIISNWDTLTRDEKNLGTFSGEAGGVIKSYNNYIEGAKTYVTYQENSTEYDAYEVKSATETVPSSVTSYKGGTSYNNFDTSSKMYTYTADSPEVAKEKVEAYAGRVDGGDFKWTFDNSVDDASYTVNEGLKSALTNYKTSLVSVGGGSVASTDTKTDPEPQPATQPATQATTKATTKATQGTTGTATKPTDSSKPADSTAAGYVLNITKDDLNSDFFKVTGNLAKDKGTATYNGETLTKCLKMESATSVTFTAPSKGKLILVLANTTKNNIKVDGAKLSASDTLLTVDLAAGAHTLTKGDTSYLYYLEFVPEGATQPTQATTAATQPATQATTAATTKATQSTTTATTKATQAPTQATTKATQPAVQPTKAADPVSTAAYDKNSVAYSGAYTNLYNAEDSSFASKVYVSNAEELEAAINNAKAGQAILLKSGTYSFDHQLTIAFGNDGAENNYKVLKAAKGADVVLDFSAEEYGETSTNARGLQMEGNYWYVGGITVKGAADNGFFVAGKHNVIEGCIADANRDSGFQISRRNSSLSDMADWPAYNYIVNCTAVDNRDPATGENADGFASKLTCGEGNVFDGCLSYCNCDDGWDLYAKPATGSIGVVTIRNCVAFNNGKLTDGSAEANGDMNGFKLGGSNGKVPTAHVVINCLAFGNGHDGFTDNGNGGALSLTNCTSYNNAKSNFNFYRTTAGGNFTGLLSAATTQTDKFIGELGNSIYANSKKFYQLSVAQKVSSGQKVGTVVNDPAKEGAFVSMNVPATSKSMAQSLRNADGSINMGGLFESTGSYEGYGAHFTDKCQVIQVNLSGAAQSEQPAVTPVKTSSVVWADSTSTATEGKLSNGSAKVVKVLNNVTEQKDITATVDTNKNGCVENGVGTVLAPAGSVVEIELVPEYGYQLTSATVNGKALVAQADTNHYQFVMTDANSKIEAKFAAKEDVVESSSSLVKSGHIKLADGELTGGTAILSVKDVEVSADAKDAFAAEAKKDFKKAKVLSVLDLSLSQVYYKGQADGSNAWTADLENLKGEAEVTLNLTKAASSKNMVIVHELHAGSYELIPVKFSSDRKTATFKVTSFSNYAIAEEDLGEEAPATEEKPATETPAEEKPAVETPAEEKPAVETPATDVKAVDTKTDVPETPVTGGNTENKSEGAAQTPATGVQTNVAAYGTLSLVALLVAVLAAMRKRAAKD